MSHRPYAASTSWIALVALVAFMAPHCGSDGGESGSDDGVVVDIPSDPGATPLTPEILAGMVSQSNYELDLDFVADVRPPGSDHWKAVQDLCAQRFADLGYTVELQEYGENGVGVNVIGVLEGSTKKDEKVIVSAHYDHIAGCEGADDNGSGVAGLLESARVLAKAQYARTLVVACWDQEEIGLVGAMAYAMRAKASEDRITVAFVYEMIGYSDTAPGSQGVPMGFDLLFPESTKWLADRGNTGDFLAIIPDESAHDPAVFLATHAEAVGLPTTTIEISAALKNSPVIADLRRSDHAPFWLNDYPAMMITDTANFRNPYYHCAAGPDSVDTLDPVFATKVVSATVGAAAEMLEIL